MSNRVPLPASTTLSKSFEYGLDVNIGLEGTPNWQPVRRMSAFAPTFPKTTEAVTSYDDLGAPNEDVTGRGFAAAFTVQGNRSLTSGLFLPEVEAIIAASKAKGEAAVLDVRWYHKPEAGTPSPNDAGRASVTVEANRQNTGDAQNEIFSVSLTGKGEFLPIANPFTGWGATAPVISGVTPEGAGDGDLVVINGAGFLGTTAVTFDADAADEVVVIGASSIAAKLPIGAAGIVPVVVTTAGGASTAFSYSRGEELSAVDFEAWAVPGLELTLGGRTFVVQPPSVDAGKKILASAVRGEVNLKLVDGPVPDEVQRVLDTIAPDEHPALGQEVYDELVAAGATQTVIDRMSYYAVFYWARGRDYADRLAAIMWTPRDVEATDRGGASPKG